MKLKEKGLRRRITQTRLKEEWQKKKKKHEHDWEGDGPKRRITQTRLGMGKTKKENNMNIIGKGMDQQGE
jgi:hypothetical protein